MFLINTQLVPMKNIVINATPVEIVFVMNLSRANYIRCTTRESIGSFLKLSDTRARGGRSRE